MGRDGFAHQRRLWCSLLIAVLPKKPHTSIVEGHHVGGREELCHGHQLHRFTLGGAGTASILLSCPNTFNHPLVTAGKMFRTIGSVC